MKEISTCISPDLSSLGLALSAVKRLPAHFAAFLGERWGLSTAAEYALSGDDASSCTCAQRGGAPVSPVTVSRKAAYAVYGKTYRGVRSLTPWLFSHVQQLDDPLYDFYKNRHGHWVLRLRKPFPCFDSSDYACESRFYRAYFICQSLKEVYETYSRVKHETASPEYLPEKMALPPMVYADDSLSSICLFSRTN